nr:reverse transcriptase domain-containing protein [Tanacetum cinerariifolium]
LADRTILKPTGVAENVFVKVGNFYILADGVVLDFIADPRVPLILGRPFLGTAHPIIDVYEGKIILRHEKQSLMLKCAETPSNFESLNKMDFIDAGESDFYSEEIENFLNDDSIPIGVENFVFDTKEDILYLESFENDDSEEEKDVVPDLHVDNSISNSENELSDNEAFDFDNPLILRPPLEPPDAEFEDISVVMNTIVKFECLDPIDEFDVFNDENNDYFPFMFVIRIFRPYLIID